MNDLVGMSSVGLKIADTEKNPMTINCITVKPCLTDTCLIRTPDYCRQFVLSLEK